MTAAEKVHYWILKYKISNGVLPKPSEIVSQLEMAIDEEKEASKELVEALEAMLRIKSLIEYHESIVNESNIGEANAVTMMIQKAEKALENHLK